MLCHFVTLSPCHRRHVPATGQMSCTLLHKSKAVTKSTNEVYDDKTTGTHQRMTEWTISTVRQPMPQVAKGVTSSDITQLHSDYLHKHVITRIHNTNNSNNSVCHQASVNTLYHTASKTTLFQQRLLRW